MISSEENMKKISLKAFQDAIKSVQPEEAIAKHVKKTQNAIFIDEKSFELPKNIHIIGFGKAVFGMFEGLRRIINDDSIIKESILSVPKGFGVKSDFAKVKIFEGAQNNLPDEDSFEAAEQIRRLIGKIDRNMQNLVFVLISGGGSALLPSPIYPITLQEKSKLINGLGLSGEFYAIVHAAKLHLNLKMLLIFKKI